MKVPKYIRNAIRLREQAAYTLIKYDSLITKFLDKHDINCEYRDLHVGIVTEPSQVVISTLSSIEKHIDK